MSFTASDIDRIKAEDLKKMPDLMVIIRGKLVPSQTKTAELGRNLSLLENAFRDNGLKQLTLWSSEWRENRMVYANVSPAYDGKNTVPNFVKSLKAVMQTEVAKVLGLSGFFTIIVETAPSGPSVVHVTVKNGEVSYQQSEFIWAEPVTA